MKKKIWRLFVIAEMQEDEPGPAESDPDLLGQASLADFLVSTRPVF